MSKAEIVQEELWHTEKKLCKLQEWLDATDEERVGIEVELASEYNMDLSRCYGID